VKLRGALLGAGNIALRGHAPQWIGDPGLANAVEIVAVADLSTDNLDEACRLFPRARPYTRAEDLLSAETLDFCDICTPPFTHRALAEIATARGVHLLCEKPIAHTLDDALEIDRAVRGAGVVFQPCHQYHFSPQWQVVRDLLPRIGHIYLVEYHVHRLAANEGNQHWDPRWRTERDLAGGGILIDHGAHIFYQLRAALGEPHTVQATVRTLLHRGYEVEDTAFVTLDFSDRLAQVSLTWAARSREILFRFVGERGEIVGDEQHVTVRAEQVEEIAMPDGMSRNSSHSEWYLPLLRDFANRVRCKDAGTAPLEEALYVTRLISRAYESCREGRALPLIDSNGNSHATAPTGEGAAHLLHAQTIRAREVAGTIAPERGRGRGRAIRIGALALLVAALLWTFHDVRFAALRAAMGRTSLAWVVLAAALNLMALGFAAARWRALVRPLARTTTLSQAFKAMMVGYTVSMVVPARAGELARAHFLGTRTGVSRASVLGTIVLDHLTNAVGLLGGLAVMPFFIDIPGWLRSGSWVALALFAVAVTAVVAMRPVERDGREPATDGTPARRLARLLGKLQHGLTGVRQPRALALAFAASLVAWTLEVGVVLLTLRAIGLSLPVPAAFLVLAAVNLALAFPVAPPANVGTLELGATLALVEFGVAKERALAFAILYHLLQVVPIAVMGVLFASRGGLARTFRLSKA
jgi:hypothetical protein